MWGDVGYLISPSNLSHLGRIVGLLSSIIITYSVQYSPLSSAVCIPLALEGA